LAYVGVVEVFLLVNYFGFKNEY